MRPCFSRNPEQASGTEEEKYSQPCLQRPPGDGGEAPLSPRARPWPSAALPGWGGGEAPPSPGSRVGSSLAAPRVQNPLRGGAGNQNVVASLTRAAWGARLGRRPQWSSGPSPVTGGGEQRPGIAPRTGSDLLGGSLPLRSSVPRGQGLALAGSRGSAGPGGSKKCLLGVSVSLGQLSRPCLEPPCRRPPASPRAAVRGPTPCPRPARPHPERQADGQPRGSRIV